MSQTAQTPSAPPPQSGADADVSRELIVRGERWQGGRTVVSLLGFALLWEVFARLTPPFVAPTWATIGEALLELPYMFVWVTTLRVLFALALSFALGVLGGLLFYSVRQFEGYGLPIVKLILAVPVINWVIFTILWFESVEWRIAFVLTVVCAPIFLIDTLDSLKAVPKHQREMVMAFRPTRRQYFTKLLLPSLTPNILTSWKVNISLAIRVVTIAELVGAISGIGYGLAYAKELFSIADVFAWTIVLVVMLMLAQQLVEFAESRLLHWRD